MKSRKRTLVWATMLPRCQPLDERNNKLYAKLNRRRKKEYTQHLEQKIELLEEEIVSLNMRVKHLEIKLQKDAVRDEKTLGDYLEANEYLSKTGLIADLQNPFVDISNKFKYFSEIVGPAAYERQKMIKAAFNTIIDSVLPDPMKFMTSLIEKGTHASSKDYERLISLNCSYSVNAELKNK